MAEPRRTERDQRRRTHGQNFLVDQGVVQRFLARAELSGDDLVVEFGAGSGALTVPVAATGAEVLAIERDPVWASRLRRRIAREDLGDRVRVLEADLRQVRLPERPYRVVANPPFGLTTALLGRLFDDPARGPWRADLLVQSEVARKRAADPPSTLRSATWAPWWTFEVGERVHRGAFRPVPRVDAAWLVARRREPPVLPVWLADGFGPALRTVWEPATRRKNR